MSYENPWLYMERTFDSDSIGDNFGFVYKITNLLNGRSYIGRKYFWSFRTPPGKKRKQKQESDWKRYYGCLLYTSPSPRDVEESRMPSSA